MGPDPARGKTGGTRGSREKANPSQAGEQRGIWGGKGSLSPLGRAASNRQANKLQGNVGSEGWGQAVR